MRDYWAPDDAFFDFLRDEQAVNAMLRHIGGKSVADANVGATAKVQKKSSGTASPERGAPKSVARRPGQKRRRFSGNFFLGEGFPPYAFGAPFAGGDAQAAHPRSPAA